MTVFFVKASDFGGGDFCLGRFRDALPAGLQDPKTLTRLDATKTQSGEDSLVYEFVPDLDAGQQATFDSVVAQDNTSPLGNDVLAAADSTVSFLANTWTTIATAPISEDSTVSITGTIVVHGVFDGVTRGGAITIVTGAGYRVGASLAKRSGFVVDVSRGLGRKPPRVRASTIGSDLLIQMKLRESGSARLRTYLLTRAV